ncbi:MAG: THUMP-like domain-containing protein, partial [Ardenticatenaceae bacterium]
HEIEPPLDRILEVWKRIPNLGVKVMPGVADEELPSQCEVEFISERGTLKEAVLWFGALRPGAARSATVLCGEGKATTLTSDAPPLPIPVTTPRAILWEPDPAVIRATLVEHLAARLGASQIDRQIAYLTSDAFVLSPFARAWPVLEHAPFNLKELNRRLRARDAHVVAVKKRGSPIEPERFRRRLKSNPDGRPVILFVTRCQDQPWMILCGEEMGGR